MVRAAARGSVLGAWLALAAVCLAGAPAGAEQRTVEAVGVAPLGGGQRLGEARQAAVASGITEAVYRVVADELPALDAAQARDVAERLVGARARDYVLRFQVVEDRGSRPAVLTQEASHEYVALVEALVDVAQVRDRLVEAGLLAPSGEGVARRVRVILEDLPSYGAYEAVREALLEQVRARSATPVEFTPRRAVLDVVTRQDGQALAQRLSALQLPGLRLVPREAGESRVRLAVARSD